MYPGNQPVKLKEGKSYLFAIGIDEYRFCNKLFNAVKDVEEIDHILTTKYQFEESTTSVLLNDGATRSDIYRKFDEYAKILTPLDTLLIYFSGHGIYLKELDEGFWIPVEGRENDTGSYISN